MNICDLSQIRITYQSTNSLPSLQELLALTGQRTVPNVFVGGKHLGGFDGNSRVRASLFPFAPPPDCKGSAEMIASGVTTPPFVQTLLKQRRAET